MLTTWSVQRCSAGSVASALRVALGLHVLEQVGAPVDAGLDAARIVGRGRAALRAGRHQHVGEAVDHHAEEGRDGGAPLVGELHAARALDVDLVEGAGDGVEARGVDDDVELVVALGGAQALLGDAHQRRLADVDQPDVGPVEGLEVVGLHRHALHAEAVVARDQLLGDLGILDPPADALGDVFGELGVGLLVGEDLAEVRQPDAEARPVVELVPQRQPLLAAHLVEAAAVGLVHEAARRARAGGEDLVVAPADVGHLALGDRPVVERAAPVRPALEDGELAHLVGDLADHLDAGGAGADHGDALARHVDRLVRPVEGMERPALEAPHALELGQGRHRQQPERQDQEAAGELAPVGDADMPQVLGLVVARAVDLAIELHVLAQAELVGDAVEVAQVLGLAGEVLLPVPFVQKLAREGVAVGPALRIEARPGIAVPVPGAAEIAAGLEHGGLDAEVDQALDLVDAGDARADDDGFVVLLHGG